MNNTLKTSSYCYNFVSAVMFSFSSQIGNCYSSGKCTVHVEISSQSENGNVESVATQKVTELPDWPVGWLTCTANRNVKYGPLYSLWNCLCVSEDSRDVDVWGSECIAVHVTNLETGWKSTFQVPAALLPVLPGRETVCTWEPEYMQCPCPCSESNPNLFQLIT
jgi:hypothetical protein